MVVVLPAQEDETPERLFRALKTDDRAVLREIFGRPRSAEAYADIREGGPRNSSLLHWGAYLGDLEAVKLITIQGRARVNAVEDQTGRTALHLAAEEGHREVVEFLLRHQRIEELAADAQGQSPCEVAYLAKRIRVARLFSNFAAVCAKHGAPEEGAEAPAVEAAESRLEQRQEQRPLESEAEQHQNAVDKAVLQRALEAERERESQFAEWQQEQQRRRQEQHRNMLQMEGQMEAEWAQQQMALKERLKETDRDLRSGVQRLQQLDECGAQEAERLRARQKELLSVRERTVEEHRDRWEKHEKEYQLQVRQLQQRAEQHEADVQLRFNKLFREEARRAEERQRQLDGEATRERERIRDWEAQRQRDRQRLLDDEEHAAKEQERRFQREMQRQRAAAKERMRELEQQAEQELRLRKEREREWAADLEEMQRRERTRELLRAREREEHQRLTAEAGALRRAEAEEHARTLASASPHGAPPGPVLAQAAPAAAPHALACGAAPAQPGCGRPPPNRAAAVRSPLRSPPGSPARQQRASPAGSPQHRHAGALPPTSPAPQEVMSEPTSPGSPSASPVATRDGCADGRWESVASVDGASPQQPAVLDMQGFSGGPPAGGDIEWHTEPPPVGPIQWYCDVTVGSCRGVLGGSPDEELRARAVLQHSGHEWATPWRDGTAHACALMHTFEVPLRMPLRHRQLVLQLQRQSAWGGGFLGLGTATECIGQVLVTLDCQDIDLAQGGAGWAELLPRRDSGDPARMDARDEALFERHGSLGEIYIAWTYHETPLARAADWRSAVRTGTVHRVPNVAQPAPPQQPQRPDRDTDGRADGQGSSRRKQVKEKGARRSAWGPPMQPAARAAELAPPAAAAAAPQPARKGAAAPAGRVAPAGGAGAAEGGPPIQGAAEDRAGAAAEGGRGAGAAMQLDHPRNPSAGAAPAAGGPAAGAEGRRSPPPSPAPLVCCLDVEVTEARGLDGPAFTPDAYVTLEHSPSGAGDDGELESSKVATEAAKGRAPRWGQLFHFDCLASGVGSHMRLRIWDESWFGDKLLGECWFVVGGQYTDFDDGDQWLLLSGAEPAAEGPAPALRLRWQYRPKDEAPPSQLPKVLPQLPELPPAPPPTALGSEAAAGRPGVHGGAIDGGGDLTETASSGEDSPIEFPTTDPTRPQRPRPAQPPPAPSTRRASSVGRPPPAPRRPGARASESENSPLRGRGSDTTASPEWRSGGEGASSSAAGYSGARHAAPAEDWESVGSDMVPLQPEIDLPCPEQPTCLAPPPASPGAAKRGTPPRAAQRAQPKQRTAPIPPPPAPGTRVTVIKGRLLGRIVVVISGPREGRMICADPDGAIEDVAIPVGALQALPTTPPPDPPAPEPQEEEPLTLRRAQDPRPLAPTTPVAIRESPQSAAAVPPPGVLPPYSSESQRTRVPSAAQSSSPAMWRRASTGSRGGGSLSRGDTAAHLARLLSFSGRGTPGASSASLGGSYRGGEVRADTPGLEQLAQPVKRRRTRRPSVRMPPSPSAVTPPSRRGSTDARTHPRPRNPLGGSTPIQKKGGRKRPQNPLATASGMHPSRSPGNPTLVKGTEEQVRLERLPGTTPSPEPPDTALSDSFGARSDDDVQALLAAASAAVQQSESVMRAHPDKQAKGSPAHCSRGTPTSFSGGSFARMPKHVTWSDDRGPAL